MEYTSYFDNEPRYLHNESEDLLEVKTAQSNIIRIGTLSAQTGEIDVRIEKPQCRQDVPQKSN